MRSTISILLLAISTIFLFPCTKTRIQLFDLDIIETTYLFNQSKKPEFFGKEITHFSMQFTDTKSINNDYENYDIHFMGKANPQRKNAYKIEIEIDDYTDIDNTFVILLDASLPVNRFVGKFVVFQV